RIAIHPWKLRRASARRRVIHSRATECHRQSAIARASGPFYGSLSGTDRPADLEEVQSDADHPRTRTNAAERSSSTTGAEGTGALILPHSPGQSRPSTARRGARQSRHPLKSEDHSLNLIFSDLETLVTTMKCRLRLNFAQPSPSMVDRTCCLIP